MLTKREFLNTVAALEVAPEEVRDYAAVAIEKMDKANAKRAAKPTKTYIENTPLVEAIVELLGAEPKTATDLAEPMGIKVQKASALLRRAVAEGKANPVEIKIKGKGTQKGYTKA